MTMKQRKEKFYFKVFGKPQSGKESKGISRNQLADNAEHCAALYQVHWE